MCGVGFGKTEVALRAMFMAPPAANKWRCWPRPRCWLAEQHYQNISDRFCAVAREGGRDVALPLAKRKSKPRCKGIEDGTIDIVVGTHKLLSER